MLLLVKQRRLLPYTCFLHDVEWLGWRAGSLVGLLPDADQGGHGGGGEAGAGIFSVETELHGHGGN